MKLPLFLPFLAAAQFASGASYFSSDGVTSTFPAVGSEFGAAINIANGNGLTGGVAALNDGNILSSSHTIGFIAANTNVKDGGATTAVFDFTFNTGTSIGSIFVWNYTQAGCCEDRGVNAYEILVDTGSGLTAVTSGNLASPNHTPGSHFAQLIDLGGIQSNVTAVQLRANSNYGGNGIGLDEVVFSDFTPVPEPGTALLGLMGILGLGLRRRR